MPLPTLDELLGRTSLPSLGSLAAAARVPVLPTTQPPQTGFTDLTPEEEESILAQLGHGTLSTLGYIGGTLDKLFGGRAIRGLLGGEARELLSIIPGSDTIGLTRPEDVVSGRDLLDPILGENKPGFQWGDIAGVAAEIALDPATYLTLGTSAAATASGKVAKLAGLLPKTRVGRIGGTLDDIISNATPEALAALENAAGGASGLSSIAATKEPLSGLLSVGLPFGIGPQKVLGTGATAQKIAEHLDDATDYLKLGNPVGRTIGSMFDYERRDVLSEPGQRVRMDLTDLRRASNAQSGVDVVDVVRDLRPLAALPGLDPQVADSLLRRAREGVPIPASELDPASPASIGLQSAASRMASDTGEIHKRLMSKGYEIGTVDDPYAIYSHRTSTAPKKKFIKRLADRLFPMEFEAAKSREEFLSSIPGGTETINRWTSDLRLAGSKRTLSDADVRSVIARDLGLGPGSVKQSQEITAWLKGLPDDLVGQRLFRDTLRDHQVYITQGRQTADAVDQYLDFVTDTRFAVQGSPSGEFVKVTDTLKRSKKFGKGDTLNQTALDYLSSRLGVPVSDLDNFVIPKSIAADANRLINGFTAPDSLQPVLSAYDWVTQSFKSGVTTPWPGFNVRNFMTGVWMGYVGGAFDPRHSGPRKYAQPWMDMAGVLAGKPVKGMAALPAFKGLKLTDAEATQRFAELAYAHGLTMHTVTNEVAGVLADKSPNTLSAVISQIPGTTPVSPIRDYLSELNPIGKSLGDVVTSPLRAGEGLTNAVENMNRGSMFLAFLRQAMDPAVAARRAKELNVNYLEAAGTEFEKQFAKRAIPFYSFAKGMIPLQLREIAEHPGGPVRQSIRLTELSRDDSGFAPPHLRDRLAIPIGGEADGTQRYLTQLDLPHEVLNDVGTGSGLLGMMNPLLKAPLELATGQSFFAGRDLRDLDPRSGRILENIGVLDSAQSAPYWLDTIIGATPAARVLTSVGQVVDPRKSIIDKAINLGTGVRISDIDMTKQREIAARETIANALRGNPGIGSYERLYAKSPEDLSPQDFMLLRLQATQRRRAQREKRAQRVSDLSSLSAVLPSL